nr:hypothetical protein BaRGS_019856 [Batillaria attramentaria]
MSISCTFSLSRVNLDPKDSLETPDHLGMTDQLDQRETLAYLACLADLVLKACLERRVYPALLDPGASKDSQVTLVFQDKRVIVAWMACPAYLQYIALYIIEDRWVNVDSQVTLVPWVLLVTLDFLDCLAKMDPEVRLDLREDAVFLETLEVKAETDPKETREIWGVQGCLVWMDALVFLVALVPRESLVSLENLVRPATAPLVSPACLAPRDRKVSRASPVFLDVTVSLVRLETKVIAVDHARLACQASRERREAAVWTACPVCLVTQACLDFLVKRVNPVRMVHRDCPACPVCLETLAHLVYLVNPDEQVVLALRDHQAHLVYLVSRETGVRKVYLDSMAVLVHLGSPAYPALLENPVSVFLDRLVREATPALSLAIDSKETRVILASLAFLVKKVFQGYLACLDLKDCRDLVARKGCLVCPDLLAYLAPRENLDCLVCPDLMENLVCLDFLEKRFKDFQVPVATQDLLVCLDVREALERQDRMACLDCLD